MSSNQQQIVNIVAGQRISNKLVLDSEQQQKREQQQQQYLEEIQKKKQQKRQRRQQAQKLQRQKQKNLQQKQKVYDKPQKMFQQDSDDGFQYKRVVKKIKKVFPQLSEKYDHYGKYKKKQFIVKDQIHDSDQDQSNSNSSNSNSESKGSHKKNDKKKKQDRKQSQRRQSDKKQKRQQKKPQKKNIQKNNQTVVVKKEKIKIEPKTSSEKKQNLVKELSIRWWYALPQWPPLDFDYKGKLNQLGYRIVDAHQFKCENDVIDGLQKALPIDGYRGVYKTKTKIIDVRPKSTTPSLTNFRNMSIQQLTQILKKALSAQIQQLKTVQYEQYGEKQLLKDLERQLIRLK